MAGDGGVFRRLRFRLFGFDEDREDEYRRLIRKEDGEIEKKYIWTDLYLITSNDTIRYAEQICLEARKNGALVLNEFWLDDTLASRAIADANKILYRPPLALEGIKGAERLQVAQSGFSYDESSEIVRIVELIGASHIKIDEACSGSYLICSRPKGNEYKAAISKKMFTDNKQWIQDCAIEWSILSVDNYVSWPQDEHQEHQHTAKATTSVSHNTPTKKEIDVNMTMKTYSSGKKANTQLREGLRGSRTEPRKRPYSPTTVAAPSSRRRLAFNQNQKSLSDYKRRDLLVKVQIPKSSLEIAMGPDHIKGFFLRSYASIVSFHCEGECIANHFCAKSFHMSLNSDQVTIDPVQLVPFTQELCSSNKKDFVLMVKDLYKENGYLVPDDIAGWLSPIDARVPDNVLTRHINMLDANEILGSFVAIYYLLLRLKRKDWFSYSKIVSSTELGIYMDWEKAKHPFSWTVLYDSLNYIHPRQLQVYRMKSQQQNSGQTICPPKPKQRDSDVFGLLGLFRDCFFHPALDYQELLLPIMLTQYPNLLEDVQKVLFALGYLK